MHKACSKNLILEVMTRQQPETNSLTLYASSS